MPITGLVIASGLPHSGTATSHAARLPMPARVAAPSSVGTVQPSLQLSVQSAPLRAGRCLPSYRARLKTAYSRFAAVRVRTLPAYVRPIGEALGAPRSA